VVTFQDLTTTTFISLLSWVLKYLTNNVEIQYPFPKEIKSKIVKIWHSFDKKVSFIAKLQKVIPSI